ncbi:type IV pilus biogenesis protein PilM [Fretibacterium fastidiosum]|uniref:type IV pilus biogenesis protein PilM n=1 Tax=Fretibacterium fastidiosum TaxID=651822 RepID=UPI001AD8179B|nr:pilus assembly protein PilM [Fretibacterium fastidiosum]
MLSRKKKGVCAGLALHEDSLRYIELDLDGQGFKVRRQEVFPLPAGCISRESIQQFNLLEKAFDDFKGQVGKFPCPVALGIPERDVILRLIDYPKMPVADIRDALSLEFEGYFPYAWNEAAADIVEVDVPAGVEQKTTVLAATARLVYVNDLLRLMERADIPVGAVEPMNVAFFRASVGRTARNGAYFVLGVEPEVTNIILGYRDNGILYRSTLADLRNPMSRSADEALMPIAQDVQNTILFARNQYRDLAIRHLILGGSLGENPRLKALLESGASLNVVVSNVWSTWQIRSDLGGVPGFDAAVGLALRDAI